MKDKNQGFLPRNAMFDYSICDKVTDVTGSGVSVTHSVILGPLHEPTPKLITRLMRRVNKRYDRNVKSDMKIIKSYKEQIVNDLRRLIKGEATMIKGRLRKKGVAFTEYEIALNKVLSNSEMESARKIESVLCLTEKEMRDEPCLQPLVASAVYKSTPLPVPMVRQHRDAWEIYERFMYIRAMHIAFDAEYSEPRFELLKDYEMVKQPSRFTRWINGVGNVARKAVESVTTYNAPHSWSARLSKKAMKRIKAENHRREEEIARIRREWELSDFTLERPTGNYKASESTPEPDTHGRGLVTLGDFV